MTTLTRPQPSPTSPGPDLGPALDRAVRDGVITQTQADRILALAETAGAPGSLAARPGPSAPRSVLPEVLGYIGGALALVSGFAVATQIWPDLAPWARTVLLAIIALGAGLGGAALRDAEGPAGRLGAFLWLVTVVAVAGTAAELAADVLDLEGENTALVTAGAGFVSAAGLWNLRRGPLQHVATFAGTIALSVALYVRLVPDVADQAGYLIWAVGTAWILLAVAGRLRDDRTAWILGAVAALVGPLVAAGDAREVSLLLGLVTAGILVTVGVRARRIAVAVLAVLGLLVYIPATIGAFFGEAMGPLAVTFVTGVVLVTVAVVLAVRGPGRPVGHDGPGPGR